MWYVCGWTVWWHSGFSTAELRSRRRRLWTASTRWCHWSGFSISTNENSRSVVVKYNNNYFTGRELDCDLRNFVILFVLRTIWRIVSGSFEVEEFVHVDVITTEPCLIDVGGNSVWRTLFVVILMNSCLSYSWRSSLKVGKAGCDWSRLLCCSWCCVVCKRST